MDCTWSSSPIDGRHSRSDRGNGVRQISREERLEQRPEQAVTEIRDSSLDMLINQRPSRAAMHGPFRGHTQNLNGIHPLSQHSSTGSCHSSPSSMHQIFVPAFDPNHYDISSSTCCFCIPLTMTTPLDRWRSRRRSARDLRDRQEEMIREHERLKLLDTHTHEQLPPCDPMPPPYEDVPKDITLIRHRRMERERSTSNPE